MKVIIRPAVEADHAFIYATYIRNRYFNRDNNTTLKRSTWSALQHKRLEHILASKPVLVACLSNDPDTILGYAFMDGDNPFSYVKLAFRQIDPSVSAILLKEIK